MRKLVARKVPELMLEPIFVKPGHTWQSHHVTNPTAFRPSFDSRVYLGYRAGGDRDHYCLEDIDVWGSSLGLAILDESGSRVVNRFPYPIMRMESPYPLPQHKHQYEAYLKEHPDEVVVMHDFRLHEHQGYIYVIYHDGFINKAFDCVKRMKIGDFHRRVKTCEELSQKPYKEIAGTWRELWENAWEPCGFKDRLIYPKYVNKNDIVFYALDSGLQMMHRPLPDIAVLPAAGIQGSETEDGETELGVLEACVRPGYFDNSHIGPNGFPTRARIGETEVFIDVCHGVHNQALTREGEWSWQMIYLPYFRVKDAESGDPLYYSREPILERDEMWREYSEEGRWVKLIPHFHILFAGGQIEEKAGKNGPDDLFSFYMGVGDTAIGRAQFTIRSLLPPEAMKDIEVRKAHQVQPVEMPARIYDAGHASGWKWEVVNYPEKRCVAVTRRLTKGDNLLQAVRPFYTVPGGFDADIMSFDGVSARQLPGLGLCIIYKGVRWTGSGEEKITAAGFGLLLLDPENPERTLYRSEEPLEGRVYTYPGWTEAEDLDTPATFLDKAVGYIPQQVKFEIKRANSLMAEGKHWRSHHTLWLRKRAGLDG